MKIKHMRRKKLIKKVKKLKRENSRRMKIFTDHVVAKLNEPNDYLTDLFKETREDE